jgi:hypothetical protein
MNIPLHTSLVLWYIIKNEYMRIHPLACGSHQLLPPSSATATLGCTPAAAGQTIGMVTTAKAPMTTKHQLFP